MRAAEVPMAREDVAVVRDPGVQKGRKVRTARMARLAATAHQVTEVVLCTRVNPGRQVNAGPRVIQAVLVTQVRRGRVVPSGSKACQERLVQLVCLVYCWCITGVLQVYCWGAAGVLLGCFFCSY